MKGIDLDFYLHVNRLKREGIDTLKEYHMELKEELTRLNLFRKCCLAKVERVDPFLEEFENLSDKIVETEKKIDIQGHMVLYVRTSIAYMEFDQSQKDKKNA